MAYIYDYSYSYTGSHLTPHIKTEKKPKDYGKCGLFRHHKVIQNKHSQYCCKYCGKTLLTLEKELRQEQKRIEDEARRERDKNIYRFFFGG